MSAARVAALRAVLLASVTLALGACDQTHFQSPLPALSACDARFVGSWLVKVGDKPTESCDTGEDCIGILTIEPGCDAWHFVEPGKEESDADRKAAQDVHLGFADVRGRKVMSVEYKADADSSTYRNARWPRDFMYLRYEVGDGTIRLYWVDSKQIERRIERHSIHGHTVKTQGRNGDAPKSNLTHVDNYVAGDSREMARVVLLPHTFVDEEPIAILKRVDAADIVKPAPTSANP